MKILFNIHLFPPSHVCGSELMALQLSEYLIAKGHQVRVVLNQHKKYGIQVPYNINGVDVIGPSEDVEKFLWADALFTHLEYSHNTIMLGHVLKRPVFHFVHNDSVYASVINSPSPVNVVYNSQWIADKLAYKQPSVVLHPPCGVDYYNVNATPGASEYITLINCNENKGGKVFTEIAKAMPDRKFLAIKGSYEEQYVANLPNVTIWDKQTDIRPAYQQTRLLLMPSDYESWGRTATEAMCNGIPVICTATPGLMENCAAAGTYIGKYEAYEDKNAHNMGRTIGRDDVGKWVAAIKSFDNAKKYQKFSNLGRARAAELSPAVELARFEEFLINAVRNYKR